MGQRYDVSGEIYSLLALRGWTQRDLAQEMGCGKNTVLSWLRSGAPRYVLLALQRLSPSC